MARKRRSGVGLKSAVALLAVIAAALGSFAVPVPSWRAGEAERRQASASDDPTQRFHPASGSTRCACGHGRRTDPDDCLAVLGIARSDGIEIAGVSTIFGNAELAVVHRTTRELAHRLTGAALPALRLRAEPRLIFLRRRTASDLEPGRSREQDSEMVMRDHVAGLGVAGHSTCPAQ